MTYSFWNIYLHLGESSSKLKQFFISQFPQKIWAQVLKFLVLSNEMIVIVCDLLTFTSGTTDGGFDTGQTGCVRHPEHRLCIAGDILQFWLSDLSLVTNTNSEYVHLMNDNYDHLQIRKYDFHIKGAFVHSGRLLGYSGACRVTQGRVGWFRGRVRPFRDALGTSKGVSRESMGVSRHSGAC